MSSTPSIDPARPELVRVALAHLERFLASADDLPAVIWLSLTLELWLRHQVGRLPDLP